MFRAGDIVFHKPTKEKWVLACDEHRGTVYWMGWPPGNAYAEDCELIKAVSSERRIETLRKVSEAYQCQERSSLAKSQLDVVDVKE